MTKEEINKLEGINDIIDFGKYNGKTIKYVLFNNPSYLVWAINNVKNFKINDILKKELLSQYNEYLNRDRLNYRRDMLAYMKKYKMSSIEAILYDEYDALEHY